MKLRGTRKSQVIVRNGCFADFRKRFAGVGTKLGERKMNSTEVGNSLQSPSPCFLHCFSAFQNKKGRVLVFCFCYSCLNSSAVRLRR